MVSCICIYYAFVLHRKDHFHVIGNMIFSPKDILVAKYMKVYTGSILF